MGLFLIFLKFHISIGFPDLIFLSFFSSSKFLISLCMVQYTTFICLATRYVSLQSSSHHSPFKLVLKVLIAVLWIRINVYSLFYFYIYYCSTHKQEGSKVAYPNIHDQIKIRNLCGSEGGLSIHCNQPCSTFMLFCNGDIVKFILANISLILIVLCIHSKPQEQHFLVNTKFWISCM